MPIDSNSNHLVALDLMPIFSDEITVGQAFAMLEQRGQLGFVVASAAVPRYFIDARKLAEQLIKNETPTGAQGFDLSIGDIVMQALEQNATWIVPVETVLESEADEDQLRTAASRVVQLITPSGAASRWYLNHEELVAAMTGQFAYLCPIGHVNYTLDHGTCGYCPRRLESVELTNPQLANP